MGGAHLHVKARLEDNRRQQEGHEELVVEAHVVGPWEG